MAPIIVNVPRARVDLRGYDIDLDDLSRWQGTDDNGNLRPVQFVRADLDLLDTEETTVVASLLDREVRRFHINGVDVRKVGRLRQSRCRVSVDVTDVSALGTITSELHSRRWPLWRPYECRLSRSRGGRQTQLRDLAGKIAVGVVATVLAGLILLGIESLF